MPQRKTYLDLMRIIACIMVIAEHVYMGFGEFHTYPSLWVLYFVGKIAVPVFIMISGAVLLPKQDSYRKTFSRLLRIGIVILVFSLLHYGVSCLQNKTPFNIGKFYYLAYNTRATASYWFLYAYFSLLLMLPLVQKMVKNFTKADFLYLILFSVVILGLFPILGRFDARLRYNEDMDVAIFGTYIGLMVAGYYLDAYATYRPYKLMLAWGGGGVLTAVSVLLSMGEDYVFFYETRTLLNITGAAMCFFYAVKWTVERIHIGERTARFISACGKLTFCTYLLGELLQTFLFPLFQPMGWTPGVLILLVLTIFVCGMLLSALLTRLPLLRKIL